METKYIIKNSEGKIYMKGQGFTNITFSRNGKAFGSIKMLKAVLKGMIRHNTEYYNGVYLKQMIKEMSTWEIVAIEIIETPMTYELNNFMKDLKSC